MRGSQEVYRDAGFATRGTRRERGAAIAEFAVVSILLWLLLAGILELGRAFAAQHVLQNAASSAARDLALQALPASNDFTAARGRIFDDGFLVADAALLARCVTDPQRQELSLNGVRAYFQEHNAPILNQLLLPLWVRDVVNGVEMLRYPGAVLVRPTATGDCGDGSPYTVQIPERDATGGYQWRAVVEPLPVDGRQDPFALANGGWAALEVRYPFQAVGMQGWRTGPSGGQSMIDAVDPADGPPLGFDFVSFPSEEGAYAGRFGLGRLFAMGREVRPFRRVLTASAAFRREVFE